MMDWSRKLLPIKECVHLNGTYFFVVGKATKIVGRFRIRDAT